MYKEVIIPQSTHKSCLGCPHHKHKLAVSGRNPVYSNHCKHPNAQNDFSSRIYGNIGKKSETPKWCPFLQKETEKRLMKLNKNDFLKIAKCLYPLAFSQSNRGIWDLRLLIKEKLGFVENPKNDYRFVFDFEVETIRLEQWQAFSNEYEEIPVLWENINNAIGFINSKGVRFDWQS